MSEDVDTSDRKCTYRYLICSLSNKGWNKWIELTEGAITTVYI